MYFRTTTEHLEKIRKAQVAEKVVCKQLYFMLVVVLDEFDFSV